MSVPATVRPSEDDEPGQQRQPGAGQEMPLRLAVRRAVTWNLTGVLLGRAGIFVSGIILARVLAPEDYGVFAVAQVVLLFVVNLNDLGLEQVLVRWPGDFDSAAPTARTLILASSLAQFVVMFAVAPFVASSMQAPDAAGVIRLLSLGVVVNGAFALPSAKLTRDLRLGPRTTADFAGFLAGVTVTLAMAVAGFGVWSLAWGRLVGNTCNGLLHALFARVRMPFGFDREVARNLVGQGLPLAGATMLSVAVLNTDTLVVGRVLGPVELGFYTMAFNLASWPVTVFAMSAWRVAVPTFGRLQHDLGRLRAAFLEAFAMLLAVALPVCVLLSGLAAPLIRFVYGPTWVPAAPALSVLAGLGALRVAMRLMDDVLVAVGRSRRVFAVQAIWLMLLVPALSVGANIGGVTGAAAAHVLVALAVALPLELRALSSLGISVRGLVRCSGRVCAGAAAAAAVAVAGALSASALDLTDAVALASAGTATLAVYAVFAAPLRHQLRALR